MSTRRDDDIGGSHGGHARPSALARAGRARCDRRSDRTGTGLLQQAPTRSPSPDGRARGSFARPTDRLLSPYGQRRRGAASGTGPAPAGRVPPTARPFTPGTPTSRTGSRPPAIERAGQPGCLGNHSSVGPVRFGYALRDVVGTWSSVVPLPWKWDGLTEEPGGLLYLPAAWLLPRSAASTDACRSAPARGGARRPPVGPRRPSGPFRWPSSDGRRSRTSQFRGGTGTRAGHSGC